MPVVRSGPDGTLHAETWRTDELPGLSDAAITGADRDPTTGRFTAGNTASRRRTLRRLARELPWLDPARCADWVRPYAVAAREHAVDLVAALPEQSPLVSPIAEELATARLAYRAFVALGLAGDVDALREARAWLREARQHALALEGLARESATARLQRGSVVADIERAADASLAERHAAEDRYDESTPHGDPTPVENCGRDGPTDRAGTQAFSEPSKDSTP